MENTDVDSDTTYDLPVEVIERVVNLLYFDNDEDDDGYFDM